MNDIPIALIAAHSTNRVIGKNGHLPWNIREDLRRFQKLTHGHPIIMGRKTWYSLGSTPLRNRLNIIVSNTLYPFSVNLHNLEEPSLTNDLEYALDIATHYERDISNMGDPKIFIIGGESLYRATIARAQILYLTEIHAQVVGDTFFPEVSPEDWTEVSCESYPERGPGLSASAYSFKEYRKNLV